MQQATDGLTRRARHRAPARAGALPLLLAALLVAGCGAPGAPSSFYRLATLEPGEPGAAEPVGVGLPRLLVLPVWLPDYLDRPQLVTRPGPHQLEVDEFHRWGGSLGEQLTLALVDNLDALLGRGAVAAYGNGAPFEDLPRLRLDVRRFEAVPGGDVLLEGRWTLLAEDGRRVLQSRPVRLAAPVGGADRVALVAAYSEVVRRLSRELAGALRLP